MGILDLINYADINKGVEEYKQHSEAVLIDVRTPEEYQEGHIPGSINIPLQQMEQAETDVKDKNKKLYVYCRSGSRSRQAAGILKEMGYHDVHNIGGIMKYKGMVER